MSVTLNNITITEFGDAIRAALENTNDALKGKPYDTGLGNLYFALVAMLDDAEDTTLANTDWEEAGFENFDDIIWKDISDPDDEVLDTFLLIRSDTPNTIEAHFNFFGIHGYNETRKFYSLAEAEGWLREKTTQAQLAQEALDAL